MSSSDRAGKALNDWFVLPAGSTRSLGLLRIGIVALIWTRWAGSMVLVEVPDPERVGFSLVFFIATTLMFVGLWTRISAALTALLMVVFYYYFGLYQGIDGWAAHHTCLLMMSSVLIALTPCGRSFSLDRYLALKRSKISDVTPPEEHGELWGLRLIQTQVFCIYFWAFFDKLNPAYLSGERLQHMLTWLYGDSMSPEWPGFAILCLVVAWSSVVIELSLAFGLFFSRLLKYLIPLGIVFHGVMYIVFPVSVFSLNMILLYLAFVPVVRVHAGIDEMLGAPMD